MASDWVTGVFAIVGAAIGSAGTMAASWTALRARREVALEGPDGPMATIRRQAYAEYLSAVDGFADRARSVVAAVENGAPLPECEAAFRGYAADWEQLQRSCSPVVIAGPANVAERAAELRGQLGFMADECDRLYKAYMQNPTRMQTSRFLHAQQSARDARSAFIAAAQAHAYGRAARVPAASSPSVSRRPPAWWRAVLRRAG
ncbi:MAG TPA: hypothetical protein VH520_08500 [Streptosporangiaceae bacterium]